MIRDESTVYHPIGAGSNVYKTNFLEYIHSQLPKNKVKISIGAQPNSIPHFGTLVVFNTAFSLAKVLQKKFSELSCSILFEMVDTAPATVETINSIEYQKSLKCDGLTFLPTYKDLLKNLSKYHDISFEIRGQADFNSSSSALDIINNVIMNHEKIDKFLAPDTQNLRIRIACPECGRSDKKAKNLRIQKHTLFSVCPFHGEFSVDYLINPQLLEYNTPLRNLIRQLLYMQESVDSTIDYCWIRLTGSDYAGFYQEQTLYKAAAALGYSIEQLPVIVYAPLVTDWSGAKLSKSLYVKKNAYRDLPTYLLDYNSLIEIFGLEGLYFLAQITDDWINNPYKLFRSYSVDYFKYMFESKLRGNK